MALSIPGMYEKVNNCWGVHDSVDDGFVDEHVTTVCKEAGAFI